MIRAILWIFRASKLLCCVSFKLRFNYFIYLIYQLFVWALLVADVNLGYMHLSTKYYKAYKYTQSDKYKVHIGVSRLLL